MALVLKNLPANAGNASSSFDPWVGNTPGGSSGNPTTLFLPGESHGQRSLVSYSPCGHKETQRSTHTHWFPELHLFLPGSGAPSLKSDLLKRIPATEPAKAARACAEPPLKSKPTPDSRSSAPRCGRIPHRLPYSEQRCCHNTPRGCY